jgi:hypothetical protein
VYVMGNLNTFKNVNCLLLSLTGITAYLGFCVYEYHMKLITVVIIKVHSRSRSGFFNCFKGQFILQT